MGRACSWSPPSSEPRRPTPPGSATKTSSTVPGPRSTAALRGVGLSPEDGALDHVGEHSVTLEPSHGIAGSRTRFTAGRIELQLDDAWHTGLAPRARRVVTAVTLPQLLGYGYVGRRPRAGTAKAS